MEIRSNRPPWMESEPEELEVRKPGGEGEGDGGGEEEGVTER